ncbi:DUF4865 family protein [Rugosimonospora africana]|nr:DUF4865 family protein [Rugosimonospora africana]
MQYDVTLPADYDMDIIRTRVATRGHLLDDRAGLGLKAYAIRERGVDGSPVNQYAPFYLWQDPGRMSEFLVGGGGFQGIVDDFGRPVVRHWTGVGFHPGPAVADPPRAASRLLTTLAAGTDLASTDLTATDLATAVAHALDELSALAGTEGVHCAALAVDAHHWQLARFVLWHEDVPAAHEATERYRVLHLSTPEMADIPTGRHW